MPVMGRTCAEDGRQTDTKEDFIAQEREVDQGIDGKM